MTATAPETIHQPDWQDFRDHIPTADPRGRRLWIFAQKPAGALYRARTWVSALLLLILFTGPFIRIHGNPLLMLNVVERRFVVFGRIFWPQDLFIFAIATLTFLVMIILFTAVYGRVWCGWLCPQTVLMEMVFRRIEYAIEGPAARQRALAAAPWTPSKIARKVLKHTVFFGLAFLVGNLLLAYIVGTDRLMAIVTDDPRQHVRGLVVMGLFALLFYGIFARFREQACTFICPYGRLQSVLLDAQSIIVAYDHRRGEPRRQRDHRQSHTERRAAGGGDCVNCRACVAVCPTGIDIRNGTQMECVNCTACIDACNATMDRMQFPRGLIRYASESGILRGERLKPTARTIACTLVLVAFGGLLAYLIASRRDVDVSMLRPPGAMHQTMPNGDISNLYLLTIVNKTDRPIPLELRLEFPAGTISGPGAAMTVPGDELAKSAAIIQVPPQAIAGRTAPIRIGVYADGRRLQTIRTSLIGPGPAIAGAAR